MNAHLNIPDGLKNPIIIADIIIKIIEILKLPVLSNLSSPLSFAVFPIICRYIIKKLKII